jgi:glycosyltransferase involved in cell wall biosynthesis
LVKKLAPSDGKVLLVTETPPGTPNGFGVTLQCLFQNTPHQVLYTDASYHEHGATNEFTLAQVPYHRSKKYLLSFLTSKIPEWRNHFSKSWLRKNLLGEHSLVYAFIYSTNCLTYASWIANQRNLPLIVHLADHCPSFEKNPIFYIIKNCAKLICITEDMRSKYESMLGRKDIEVLHNGAESNCYRIPLPSSPPFNDKNPFTLCFLGGLFSHLHGECIEDIIAAILILRKEIPWLKFDLYGQIQPRNFLSERLKTSGVTHHGVVMPLDKKYEIMEQAHCFLIPSSFKSENHENYRYSFPTKLPELIASGRPIISYGPSNTATNRLLAGHKLGTRINHRSVRNVVYSLSRIIDRYDETLQEVSFANSKIIHSFSADKARNNLNDILNVT